MLTRCTQTGLFGPVCRSLRRWQRKSRHSTLTLVAPFLVAFLGLTLPCHSAIGQTATDQTGRAFLLPTAQLTIGPHEIQVEIAATAQTRAHGLMFRQDLPPDQGMLFVFDETAVQCFWMKNTPLPLSIAFIDPQGVIVNVADMQPHSEQTHCPVAPIRYALEMEQGWFGDHGVVAGASVVGLPPASLAH